MVCSKGSFIYFRNPDGYYQFVMGAASKFLEEVLKVKITRDEAATFSELPSPSYEVFGFNHKRKQNLIRMYTPKESVLT